MLSDSKTLKAAARDALQSTRYDPKRLVLIHTGVTLLVSAFVLLVDYLLAKEIGAAVGLSGMNKRATLETARSVLQFAQLFLLPLWEMGFIFAALKIARKEPAEPEDLLQGFRRLGSLLRLQLLMGILLVALIIVCSYAASFVFMISPWGKEMMAQITALVESGADLTDSSVMESIIYSQMQSNTVPLALIIGGILLLVVVPIFYRLRFAQHIVLDGERSARMAMRLSRRYTKGNCLKLLKLDFSFWWYYLLALGVGVLAYGDQILELAGIALPWSSDVGYVISTALYMLGLLALNYYCRCLLEVTYAQAYYELKPHEIQIL